MKKRFARSSRLVFTLAVALILPSIATHAASVLDVGTQYRLRAISLSNADYGATPDQNYSYMSQRALAYIGGKFSPNIEMMFQMQAIGVAGSSASVSNLSVNPSGDRYPNTSFTPWVQNAYIKASQLYDMPIDLTIGRQPITLGDGMLLSDDELGFTGLRMQARLPYYGLRADTFMFQTMNTINGNANKNVYGLELTKPFRNIRVQASWITEHDGTGQTLYIRPSEYRWNAAKGYDANTDFNASQITRNFMDFRLEGRLLEGGFYKSELAFQSGHVSRSSSTLGSVDLGGYAFLVSGGLFTRFSKYGPVEIHGLFGQASGDSGGGTDNSFQPSYGHQFDGMERSGFGELYGSSLYNAVPSSTYNPNASTSSVSGLPPGYSGVRVIGAGLTTHPTALLSIGIDYYVYQAMETPTASFPVGSTDSSLGSELDIGLGFAYTSYLSFRGSAAFFSPGKAYANQSNAKRFLIEAVGRF